MRYHIKHKLPFFIEKGELEIAVKDYTYHFFMDHFSREIRQLKHFSEKEEVAKIIAKLNSLQTSKKAEDGFLTELKDDLKKLMLDPENNGFGYPTLAEAAHCALVALTKYKPVNNTDPITQDEIPCGNRVFVSTGHQLDIHTLIEWHNNRGYRGSTLGETDKSKWLLNPITNDKFHVMDAQHIQRICNGRGVKILDLKPEATKINNYYSIRLESITRDLERSIVISEEPIIEIDLPIFGM